MTFVVVLLAYMVRRALDSRERLDPDNPWRALFRSGARVPSGREARRWPGILLVLVPTLVLLVLSHWLRDSSWYALTYPLDLLILILLLGAPGWSGRLQAYAEAWQRGDMAAARHHVKDCLKERERGQANSPSELHLTLARRFMTTMFERYFLLLFWYVVGGIAVAILVRGTLALRDHWPQGAARPGFGRAADLLAWLPARLLSLSFGLAGDLAGWLSRGRPILVSLRSRPEEVLLQSADGALTGYALDPKRFERLHPDQWLTFGDNSLTAIRNLLNRSLLVWICVFALLVIAGFSR
ncbi:MAG: regulatory signaling modulator protein AmpE [Marinobacter sp.]|uniref:regulatory signaling modulator protein AmpE n=1 Tax=Marinobacter sp. TaxID=50741 RepID=UPI00299E3651|nr:regulatory signaling modulator protein AmpE [Marinobacter sp.]MDX1635828.1 regulatory signaling modulator protein AmpE [Marinobacter sp.]